LLAISLAALASACSTSPAQPPGFAWPDPAGSVAHPELAALCREAWELRLAEDPIGATRLGDPRYHGALPDVSRAADERRAERLRDFARRAGSIRPSELSDADRMTHRLLEDAWRFDLAEHDSGIDLPSWHLEARGGPQVEFLTLGVDQPVATERERAQLLERWGNMPLSIRRSAENLRRGLAAGRVASRTAVEQVLVQLDALLATPVEESPLVAPAAGGGPDDPLATEERARFAAAVQALVRDAIYPEFRAYRELVAREVLPRARSDERPGVCALDGGAAYYRLCVARHTTLDPSSPGADPAAIHALGLAEVARIRAEIEELGARVLGVSGLPAIQEHLRGSPEMHFRDAAEVQRTAEEALARAIRAEPRAFGRRPRARCEVVPIPEHEAPFTTIAYYRQPAADGSRPGRYYVNTYAPTTRTRYEAEALAFHEAVPGHHLQVAIAQELDGLPLLRRHGWVTAFGEGWALYTERLCDELGLYTSDLDRLGMLSFDAWRASRLVVDTGLHLLGWSRAQAIEYMAANTLLARNNVENEVDRYIATPGQALAYKIGQLEILGLRARAQAALGSRFDLREFHDRVLENGGVSLSVLREQIEAWIARRSGA
jgi:uncharacterized protein (DUF885 family)